MEEEKSDSEGQKKRKLSENQVSTYSSTSESLGRTRSSVTSIQSEVTVLQRGRKINDKTLDPTSGDLKIRLDADFHYPIPPGKNKYPLVVFVAGRFRMGRQEIIVYEEPRFRRVTNAMCPFAFRASNLFIQSQALTS
jgi:hypothetical protein